jgi:O-antigen/teichoic acid export membrane protein
VAEIRTGDSVVGAGSMVALGMMAMNVMVYAFTLVSAHVLEPASFGGLGAVLAILIVVSVGALALQATAARTIAIADDTHKHAAANDILASTRAVAFALGAVMLVLSPVIRSLLDVPWSVALMLPFAVVPLTLLGGYAGVLQGSREWRRLTGVFLALGLGRLLFGGIALLIDNSLPAAVAGLTAGAYLPAVVGWLGCRRVLGIGPGSGRRLIGEVWQNGHMLLAFFALTNMDVLLARNLLSAEDSGIYAAGAILTKSCLFLPQFVIIIAFPTIAEDQAEDDQSREWLKPLGLVGMIGMIVTLGTAFMPDLTVTFVGGSEYAELHDYVWLFAVQGTAFALLQMVVYRQIARRATSAAFYLWGGSALLIAVVLGVSRRMTLDQPTLVLLVIAVTALIGIPVARAKPRLREGALP